MQQFKKHVLRRIESILAISKEAIRSTIDATLVDGEELGEAFLASLLTKAYDLFVRVQRCSLLAMRLYVNTLRAGKKFQDQRTFTGGGFKRTRTGCPLRAARSTYLERN